LPSTRDFDESFDPELLKTEGLSRAAQAEELRVKKIRGKFHPSLLLNLALRNMPSSAIEGDAFSDVFSTARENGKH
jgi:hypothetical protein